MTSEENGKQNQVQVVARAAAIMRAVEGEAAGLSVGQIALKVGLPRSTVQRVVGALATEGLLISGGRAERVRLGPLVFRLASSVANDAVTLARPVLVQLSGQLRETVDLAILRDQRMIFVDQVVGPERLRTVSTVGDSFPLYCSANGKAVLAQMEDEEIRVRCTGKLERLTGNTISNIPALLKNIGEVRREGVAWDLEEHALGVSAGGVCLRDLQGHLIALSVPAPTARFEEKRAAIRAGLLEAKRVLQERFGQPD